MKARAKAWNRVLWGVLFTTGHKHHEPVLIGALWARDLGGVPYQGEPTRTLLFTSRAAARAWCASKLEIWRAGRSKGDFVLRWRVRPVRVRETVRVVK